MQYCYLSDMVTWFKSSLIFFKSFKEDYIANLSRRIILQIFPNHNRHGISYFHQIMCFLFIAAFSIIIWNLVLKPNSSYKICRLTQMTLANLFKVLWVLTHTESSSASAAFCGVSIWTLFCRFRTGILWGVFAAGVAEEVWLDSPGATLFLIIALVLRGVPLLAGVRVLTINKHQWHEMLQKVQTFRKYYYKSSVGINLWDSMCILYAYLNFMYWTL